MSETEAVPGYEFLRSASGAVEGLALKLGELPAPERTFSANAAALARREDDFEITFYQVLPGGTVGASLVVTFGRTAIKEVVQRNPNFIPSMREAAAKLGWSQMEAKPLEVQRDRTTLVRASLINLGFWNDDGEITFYRLSPREYQIAAEGKPVQMVYPVVAVLAPSRVFYAVVERLAVEAGIEPGVSP